MCLYYIYKCILLSKEVLREHKRHTNPHVSSTPSAVLSQGVPHPWAGVYPMMGYPLTRPGGGTPSLDGDIPIMGYPPAKVGTLWLR